MARERNIKKRNGYRVWPGYHQDSHLHVDLVKSRELDDSDALPPQTLAERQQTKLSWVDARLQAIPTT